MKTYKKPEIELSSFDTDIITTSNLTVETQNGGIYKVETQGAKLDFAVDNKITINPWNE